MSHEVSWGDIGRFAEQATHRSFVIHRSSGAVPGTVWMPTTRPGPLPLVLLGHGGSGHRHSDRILSMAAQLTLAGCAAAAIDGPHHGDRVATPLPPAEYQARIAAEGIANVLDRIAEDWLATTDVLADTGIANHTHLAYFGLSMGTRFGLPTAAALGPALRCAVFGKFGTQSATAMHPGLHAPQRALTDASHITAPILFHLQQDDELFPRPGQLQLFDAFASPTKQLLRFPGHHRDTPEHAPSTWCTFITHHLIPTSR